MPGSMSDTYQDASSNSDSYDSSAPWIQWFTSLEGHEYLIPVAEEFIEDDFNLTGLQSSVPFYRQALDMILDVEMDPEIKDDEMEKIEASASSLFLLIHQRFLLSKQGLHLMASRYRQCDFGECPRMLCRDMPLIPIGLSDIPGKFSAKLFCPNCVDIYNAPFGSSPIDGVAFGTTFPHLLFKTYPDLLKEEFSRSKCFHPTIFGFKIHASSKISKDSIHKMENSYYKFVKS